MAEVGVDSILMLVESGFCVVNGSATASHVSTTATIASWNRVTELEKALQPLAAPFPRAFNLPHAAQAAFAGRISSVPGAPQTQIFLPSPQFGGLKCFCLDRQAKEATTVASLELMLLVAAAKYTISGVYV
jgi:hypothetical protein